MSIYFYYGDEDYNIEQAIDEKRNLLDKNFSAMNFKSYDNPSFIDLISILRTTPMMFGKMLIVINCIDYFSNSFEDSQNKQLEEALSLVSDEVDIIFTAILPRNENKKLFMKISNAERHIGKTFTASTKLLCFVSLRNMLKSSGTPLSGFFINSL